MASTAMSSSNIQSKYWHHKCRKAEEPLDQLVNKTQFDNRTITHPCSGIMSVGYDIPQWGKVTLRTMNGCLKCCLHSRNTANFKGRAAHESGVWGNNRTFTYTQIAKEIFGVQKQNLLIYTIYTYIKIFVIHCTTMVSRSE